MTIICLLSLFKPSLVISQPLTDSTVNYFTLTDYYDHYYDSLIQLRGSDSMQGTGYKDYLRWKWFYYSRHGVNGELGEIWNAVRDYHANAQGPQGYIDNSDWQFMGPYGIPLGHGGDSRDGTGKGMMLSIWVSGGDHSLIYAGSHHGGLWKTEDGGENWYPLHDDDARIHGVNSIAVDPEYNDIVYITCNNSLSSFSDYSSGLFKSSNGGITWEQLFVPDTSSYPTMYFGASIRQIKLHPLDPGKLFFSTYKNVYMSSDHGNTWDKIFEKNYYKWADSDSTNFDRHNGLFDLEVDCLNDSLYYLAGSEIFILRDSANAIDSINMSQDVFLIGLNPGDSLLLPPHRAAVSVDCHFPGTAWFCYVAEYKRGNFDSISLLRIVEYSSIDHSFRLIFEARNVIRASGNMLDFEATHSDTNVVDFYIGAVGVVKTDINNGMDITHELDAGAYPGDCWLHLDKRDLFLFTDHAGHDTLYIANDAGISWGTEFEDGQSGCGTNIWHWRHPMVSLVNGLNVTEFYGIGVSELGADLVAGGCQDLNNMLNYEGRWINFGTGDGSQLIFDPNNKNIFYFSEWQSSTLFRTNNLGMTFESGGFYTLNESTAAIPLELDPVNPSILYSGGKDLLKFIGVNNFSHDVDDPIELEHFNNIITDIEVVKNGAGRRIYVSTDKVYYPWANPPDSLHFTGSVYFSDDNGNNFTDISDSLKGCFYGFVSDIEVDPNHISTIWAASVGFSKNTDQEKKVFKSTNSGSSWIDFSQGLPPGLPVYKIRYIPEFEILLAATDVGIFKYSSEDSAWMPYNNGLPLKIITDLEVNKEYNYIAASTYGRGIWKTPILCDYNEAPWTIRENLEWGRDTILDCSIVIDENITVTLSHCKIFMPADAKIVVKRGAELILNGCTLTSACNDLWWGIEVWGNSDYAQSSSVQGRIEVKNNSIVEKARKAIFCGKNIENTYPEWAYTGGIVDAGESTFKNNRYGVQLWTYRNPQIMARFEACKFQTDQILADGSAPEYFMTLVQVNGVEIKGCNFEYDIVGIPDFRDHGRGIYAIDAGFEVMPDTNYNQSTFKGLDCGIFALRLYENMPLEVHESRFINNLTGIYTSAIEGLQIYLNEFDLNFDSIPASSQIFGGIYMDNCTGYMIEENVFGESMQSELSPSIGITINNSGEADNEIYKNTFNKLFIGTLSQNVNRNMGNPNEGLKLSCNIYNQNEYDIVVTGPQGCNECGISKTQGSHFAPAGNLFSKTGIHPTSDFDNQMDSVNYYHHKALLTGTNRWIPSYKSDSVYLYNTPILWDTLESCSSHVYLRVLGSSYSQYVIASSKSDSISNLLQELIDGGNTDALAFDVNIAQPEEALNLHNELLGFSPYLSDTILIKSAEKEDVLSPVMVKDIMVANPQSAKSSKVVEALENRDNELPEYMMDVIMEGKDSIGHKEILESDLFFWNLQKEVAMNQLIHFFRSDTAGARQDSIIYLLENGPALQSKYRLMMAYLDNEDTASALSILENIPFQFDLTPSQSEIYQHWESFLEIILQIKGGSVVISDMDSIKLVNLTYLSLYEDIPGSLARNILHYIGIFETGPYYLLPEHRVKSYSSVPAASDMMITKRDNYLKIYPNPAKDYLVAEYDLGQDYKDALLSIYTSDGKMIYEKTIDNNIQNYLINTHAWKQGIYFYKLVMRGQKDQNGKFIILK